MRFARVFFCPAGLCKQRTGAAALVAGASTPSISQIVPQSLGQCVGAFAECSSDIHLLLREAARCAAMRYWHQEGTVSVEAAVATYSARYRRHWGAELALQGARLRFSRAYLAFQAPTCQAGMTFRTSSISVLTRPTAHNMQRKRHPSLEDRRVARIVVFVCVAAALCLFLSFQFL